MERTLRHLDYPQLGRQTKDWSKQYLSRLTGLCRAQLTRLIGSYAAKGSVTVAPYQRRKFPAHYTEADIRLLAYVDQAHGTLSGPATRRILQREYREYHIQAYQRLAQISSAQIYRFRKTAEYRKRHTTYQPTRPTPIPIGERRKPDPHGRPGYLRIDTVHQETEMRQGVVSHQRRGSSHAMQVVGATPHISEAWLLPVLEAMLEQFPFRIPAAFIPTMQRVHQLSSFRFIEQTPDRADQVAATSFRRQRLGGVQERVGDSQTSGWTHIASRHADAVNQFHRQHLNPYLNFHRPCGIAELRTLARGKIKRVYRQWDTPWDILRSLPDWETSLRAEVDATALQLQASAHSDTDAAVAMQQAKRDLFHQLSRCSACKQAAAHAAGSLQAGQGRG